MKKEKKYTLSNWFRTGKPNLYTSILLWIWKRNKYIEATLLPLLTLLSLSMVFGYWILIMKKLGSIIAFPIWVYLAHIFFKYTVESGDEARKIYNKKNKR